MTDGVTSWATSTSGPSRSLEEIRRIAGGAQVHGQPADDVGDVALALAQVGILGLVEERRDVLERALQRRLGVQPLGPDRLRRAPDEHRVVEHQELRVEEVGVLGAGAAWRCAA